MALAAGCAARGAPLQELEGRWGRSEAACAAGLVLRFEARAVVLEDGPERRALLADPRYRRRPQTAGIEIAYRLPDRPGAVSAGGGRGELALRRDAEGALHFAAERFIDLKTGAVRMPLDPEGATLAALFPLQRCDGPAFGVGMRGRGA